MRWETGGGVSASVTLMWSQGDVESLQSKSLESTSDGSFVVPSGDAVHSDYSMLVMGSKEYGSCSIWVDGVKVNEDVVRGSDASPDGRHRVRFV
ncbi:hypothetical protein M2280_005354 [Prescottella agglutinans]|uniref:Uncharacterized protein n=1 Tax=Prescottella agglutinans TaxID=1644129 RepID=A0ABT6MIF7_9NOCA|nr:hypothetical protein [Prescottella agglutinans]